MKQNLRYLCYDTLGCSFSPKPCRTTLNRCSGLSQCVVHVSIDNFAEKDITCVSRGKEKFLMVSIDQVKEYSRIEADEQTINTLIMSASSFFKSKGITYDKLNDADDIAKLDLAILMLVDHWYNNRGVTTEKVLRQIPMGIQSIIFTLQLKCKQE